MAKKLFRFVDDVFEGLVSEAAFYQGLFNLCEAVLTHSASPHKDEHLTNLRIKENLLTGRPDLFGALCFRELLKRPRLSRETPFLYTVSNGPNYNLEGVTLVQGLEALAFGIKEPGEDVDSPAQFEFDSVFSKQSLVAAAFFSARSLAQLEPLDEHGNPPDHCSSRSQYVPQRRIANSESTVDSSEQLYQLDELALSDTTEDDSGNEITKQRENQDRERWRLGRIIESVFSDELPPAIETRASLKRGRDMNFPSQSQI